MQLMDIEDNKINRNALVLSENEYLRIRKLSKLDDDKVRKTEEIKRLNKERKDARKALAKSRAIESNKRNRGIEERRKLLADIEAKQLKRDEEIKLKILQYRKITEEKAQKKKWLEKDSTKMITQAEYLAEVLRERDMQIEFNKTMEMKAQEEDRLLKIEENREAEQYRKDRWNEKLKEAENRKANAAIAQNELKQREDERRKENLRLKEESEAEIQRILKEIEEENEINKTKIRVTKENLIKQLNESRKIAADSKKLRQLDEQEEDMVVAAMGESKKRIAKTQRLKEIQLLKEKQMLLAEMSEKAARFVNQKKNDNLTNLAHQKAIEEKEQWYQNQRILEEELMKKKKKEIKDSRKIYEGKCWEENERLKLNNQWEMEKRLQETEVLYDLEKSSLQKKIEEMKSYRNQLDAQCENNRRAQKANGEAVMKRYNEFMQLRRQEDEEFLTYAKKAIEKYEKAGKSAIPFRKAITRFVKNNRSLANDNTKVHCMNLC